MRRMIHPIVASVILVACGTDGTGITGEREWQAVLQGGAGWEHLSGSTVVRSIPGTVGFTATAALSGDEAGVVRPWHVHFNTCAQGGGIVGQDADYPRLTVGANGSATVTVTVPHSLDPAASYHVNVHRADNDLATIIACGDLSLVN
jgi:hypothetical protein